MIHRWSTRDPQTAKTPQCQWLLHCVRKSLTLESLHNKCSINYRQTIMTTLNKSQQRDLSKTLPMIAHLGKDFGARVLSALHRSAMKKSQQDEILAIALAYSVVSSDEFIIS
jgi:hypothetical protein